MADTPTVLFIAYYFPPLGGAGVQRTLKFARYLPDFGWKPHVVTVRDAPGIQDSSLVEEIPTQLVITRTPGLSPSQRLPWKLRNLFTRWFLVVDEQIGWLPFAISAGKKVIASEDSIRVIYSTSAPFTAHLVARQLHRQTQLPWVADFRDPWMENPFITHPTTIHQRINTRLEQSIFHEADRVIFNTEAACDKYARKYPSLAPHKLVTIPNGYDQEDLPKEIPNRQPALAFNIVHYGSLYRKTRSSAYFLYALKQCIRNRKFSPGRIHLRFIGNIDKETQGYVDQYGLNEIAELPGYLPHRQALAQLFSADLLLLIPSYGTGSELFVPAKIYEYLASQKPILCLAEGGACADLVIQARAGWLASPKDTSQIANQLVRLYHLWENGALKIDPDLELIASFERRKLTGRLASIFGELVKTAG